MAMARCCCGESDDAFGSGPRCQHWAEFWSAFFFTGCFGVPILLANTKIVPVGAMVLSLAGIVIPIGSSAFAVWLSRRGEDSVSLTGTLGFA